MTRKRSREGSPDERDGNGRGRKRAKKGFSVGPANLPDGTHRRKVKKIKDSLIHKAQVKKQYAKIKEEFKASQPEFTTNALSTAGAADGGPEAPSELGPGGMHPDRQAMIDQGGQSSRGKRKNPRQSNGEHRVQNQQRHAEEVPLQGQTQDETERQKPKQDLDGERKQPPSPLNVLENNEEQGDDGDQDQDSSSPPQEQEQQQPPKRGRKRRPKPSPFHNETKEAEQRKAEAAERRQQREAAQETRQKKLEGRERQRKAMAKARKGGRGGGGRGRDRGQGRGRDRGRGKGGKDNPNNVPIPVRKLGRESKVLLEKVKTLVGDD